ncbi:hypothetical protein BKG58_10070 [Mycobacteroides abscessus subsp. abscessus]|jgi:hypothetical protein|nr:hypothetical protein MA3A0122R_4179 [Mycobacteroides abscessus 3A-0122-R]EIV29370.1 hypothetical protein MA3A0119R_0796 [Mycobacteroides abscessus 3A-0119-R]EIV33618.1 hypothetical protein MA3A0122S_3642 [Mycobacteroides abscessus 3A-0122-S]EIV35134.1 hypothetical protein MA3A0731_4173 [Mycobacteroides abscessus 3A-0731]EIV44806.1 hypothetical protein MA3A0930R_4092 [Mycobacteroides abscessus 3A-0930-R]EIV46229.1 hypothetical protein MA3A0930S_4024 [Mycobacteroides abscessus 3A-0930-S]EIV6
MDAFTAICEVINAIPDFFREKRLVRNEVRQGWSDETAILSQAEIAVKVARALLHRLGDRGYQVVWLPPVNEDEFGTRTVQVPLSFQPWADGEVRLNEHGTGVVIAHVPSRLPIRDAPQLAAALLAAHRATRTKPE